MPLNFGSEFQKGVRVQWLIQQFVCAINSCDDCRRARAEATTMEDVVMRLNIYPLQWSTANFINSFQRLSQQIFWTMVEFFRALTRHAIGHFVRLLKPDFVPNIQCDTETIKPWTQIGRCGRHTDFYHE